ncbi:MAG: hypothetical protein A2V85_03745 [Chloroflexi bacterium RBG_16_72_14]|nr:MAG: hypothetical protein A2V85_03745 [Chloroflexi bacterium RBG_16_72_14]
METRNAASPVGGMAAPVVQGRPGTTRIKVAVVLLAMPTVISAVFLVFAVPKLLLGQDTVAFYLNDAAITWPTGVPVVAVATALLIGATWRGWGLDSLRLLLLASVAWLAAGAYVVAAGGTASLLVISAIVLVLLASVARDRRRWMRRPA